MNFQDLGRILNEMYIKAPQGKQDAKIHLFGLKYADVIQRNHYSFKDIVAASGISTQQKSLSTTLCCGFDGQGFRKANRG